MNYMGSKRKFTKDIVPIINKYIEKNQIENFYDCFCGGGNVIDKVKCENLFAFDLCPELIALHQQAQIDFEKLPKYGSREMWDLYYGKWKVWKKSDFDERFSPSFEDLYMMGAAEWYGSFTKGGWTRGFAKNDDRDYWNEANKAHQKQVESENYKKIKFDCCDYRYIEFKENSLVYADAPYRNTKPYPIEPHFDYDEYYTWLWETSKKVPIFVSEQFLPEDFDKFKIWTQETKRTNNPKLTLKAQETLWLIDQTSK